MVTEQEKTVSPKLPFFIKRLWKSQHVMSNHCSCFFHAFFEDNRLQKGGFRRHDDNKKGRRKLPERMTEWKVWPERLQRFCLRWRWSFRLAHLCRQWLRRMWKRDRLLTEEVSGERIGLLNNEIRFYTSRIRELTKEEGICRDISADQKRPQEIDKNSVRKKGR